MFNTLYRYPSVVARHCEGPSAPERERFLIHCANEGMAQATLLQLAPEMLVIARRINIEGGRFIDAAEVEDAGDRWIRYQRRHHRIRGSRFSRERFIQTATAWLRFLGQLQPLNEKPLVYADLIDEFGRYMREERGLSLRTIQSRRWHVRAFLNWLNEEAVDLAELRLEQIDAFLALKSKQGWCRVSVQNHAYD
jgi:integrase/recombinase XerD